MSVRPEGAARSPVAAVLLAALVALFVIEARHPQPQIDDAYITYQYARNLVEGHGLVFNRGEYVEGYTNLLWALLVACGLALGARAETAGWLLGLVSGVATLIVTHLYARAILRREHAWAGVVAASLVLSATSFGVWSLQGMETALFAAAVTATLAAQVRGRMGWATCFAIVATLTRMEGGLVAAVILGLDPLGSWRRWQAWRWVGIYGVFLALLTGYRLAYYGMPLPNVFYAKVGGVPVMAGVGYAIGFLYDGVVWLLPAAVVGAVADRRLWPAAVFVALYAAYVVAVGGDSFAQWRFFVPILPALAVFAIRGVEHASSWNPYASVLLAATIPMAVAWLILGYLPPAIGIACAGLAVAWASALGARRLSVPGVVAAALALGIGLWPAAPGISLASTKRARDRAGCFGANTLGEMIGRRSAEKFLRQDPLPRLIASGGVGRLAYYTQLPILDVLGLVDPVVAHSREASDTPVLAGHGRSNATYVLSREPDYFFIPQPGTFIRIPALVALWEHPDFKAHYVWDPDLEAYRRRDVGATAAATDAPVPGSPR